MIYKLKTIDFLYILFILSIVFIYFNNYSLNVDSSWILYASSQILEGETLYTDISEVNPPLIFIYSILPIILSKYLQITYFNSYIIFVLILVIFSVYLSYTILKKGTFSENQIRYYIYSIIFILTLGTYGDFGQREHLLIIFIMPYIILSLFRKHIKIPNQLLLIITLFAILGFNLKPHFFLIFITIELIYIFHSKSLKNFFRWDSFFILFSGLFYICLTMIFFPEYLNFAVPLAVKTYTTLFNKSFFTLLLNLEVLIFLLTFLVWIIFSKNKFSLDNIILLCTIATLLIIYLIQQKGWFYHRLPFISFTYFFLIHIFINYIKKEKTIYILLFLPLFIISANFKIQTTPRFIELKNIVNSLPKKAKVHIVSSDIARGQTLLNENQIWTSRFGALGILPYILTSKDAEVKKYLFDSLYTDLIEKKPDFIIFCGKYSSFNYYNYFSNKDKRLKKIYNIYYTKSIIDGYTILKRTKKE